MKTKSTVRITLDNTSNESIDSFIKRLLAERKALKSESFFDIKGVYKGITFIATIDSTKDSLYADYCSKAKEPVDGYAGEHITEYCKRLIEMRGKVETNFIAQFNGGIITVTKEATASTLQSDFQLAMEKNAEEYEKTDAYKEQQVRTNKDVEQRIVSFNKSMLELDTLNFKDYNIVLTWLHVYCDSINHVTALEREPKMGVSRIQVADKFKENVYLPNVNCGDNFKEDNEENVARYLIGQVLSFLERNSAVPEAFDWMYKDYKKKFKIK